MCLLTLARSMTPLERLIFPQFSHPTWLTIIYFPMYGTNFDTKILNKYLLLLLKKMLPISSYLMMTEIS